MSPRESYLQTLDLLQQQREKLANELTELDMVINGLERLANREASPAPVAQPVRESHDILPPHAQLAPYSEMEFIPAAEDYLQNVGIPQTTPEIAEALVARGFRTRSKDFKNTAQALLKRAADAGRPLRRIGRSTWAYDDARPSSSVS